MKEEKIPTFAEAIKEVGVITISSACGCSVRSIYKWMKKGCLPRTDFTGETNYAAKIALASKGKFSKELIIKISRPQKPTESAIRK